jgi:hypothetical protein
MLTNTGPPGICVVMFAIFCMVIVGDGGGETGFKVNVFLIYSIFMPLGSHWLAPENPVGS